MAALAVQTKQPIAGFQPVDHDVLKAFAPGNQKAVVIGKQEVDFINCISVRELVFSPPEGWVITDTVAELIGAIFIDVNGGKAMNLVPGLYSGALIVQRTLWAQNLNNIKLTLEVNGELVGTKVVDLMKIPADTCVYLKIADFQANHRRNVVVSVSLTNHDVTWKTGLTIAGALVHPASPGIKN